MSGQISCDNNRCLNDSVRCNGNPDCQDGSDELGCGVSRSCPAGYVACRSVSAKCLVCLTDALLVLIFKSRP